MAVEEAVVGSSNMGSSWSTDHCILHRRDTGAEGEAAAVRWLEVVEASVSCKELDCMLRSRVWPAAEGRMSSS